MVNWPFKWWLPADTTQRYRLLLRRYFISISDGCVTQSVCRRVPMSGGVVVVVAVGISCATLIGMTQTGVRRACNYQRIGPAKAYAVAFKTFILSNWQLVYTVVFYWIGADAMRRKVAAPPPPYWPLSSCCHLSFSVRELLLNFGVDVGLFYIFFY